MMKRIICIGNQYIPEDAAGSQVYERLLQHTLPSDVQVIDGGLAGLNLLQFIEGAERVAFVDNISGFGQYDESRPERSDRNKIFVLETADVIATTESRYGHAAGLAYLLRVLPDVCDGIVPHILLVGIEGQPNKETIDQAAVLALNIVIGSQEFLEVQNGNQD